MSSDLEAIRARLAAATPGPWIQRIVLDGDESGPNGDTVPLEAWSTPGCIEEDIWFEAETAADAELIAHAPADIAALLAEVDAANGALAAAPEILRLAEMSDQVGAWTARAECAEAERDAALAKCAGLVAEVDRHQEDMEASLQREADIYRQWLIAAHPWCTCAEGPYFGAQLVGTPIRCERCGRDESTRTALTKDEIQHLADHVLGGAMPSTLMIRAVERILADRLATHATPGADL